MAADRKRNQVRHVELQSHVGNRVFHTGVRCSALFVVMYFAAAVSSELLTSSRMKYMTFPRRQR